MKTRPAIATGKAREVLADCRTALALLEDEGQSANWRVHWAAAVALVRAVGHVLAKVDGRDADVKRAADAAFGRWKSDERHAIFRDFIERERNNLLKEYHSDVHPLEEVSLAVEMVARPVGGGSDVVLRDVLELGENIYRPMLDGPWEGDDARDVLEAAFAWWEEELDGIDTEVARARQARAEER